FSFFFLLSILLPPRSTLFPYTTLFRSFDLNLGMKDFLVESRSLLNLYKIYEATEMENTDEIIDNIITLDENRGINKFINTEEYLDRKSTRLNSSHVKISYAVFCLKKKK